MEHMNAIGGLLSGLAAILGLALATYAGFKAIPNEMQRWRTQKREEHRALAASEALIAIRGYANALNHVASPISFGPDTSKDTDGRERPEHERRTLDSAQFRESYNRKWTEVDKEISHFLETWKRALVFLDDDVESLFERLWNLRADMKSGGDLHADYLRIGSDNLSIEERSNAMGRAVGPSVRKRIDTLSADADKLLKPIIRLAT